MNCRAKCSSLLCWLAVTNESLKHFYQSCHFVGHSGRYPQHSILPLRHRNAAVGLASYGVVVVVLRPLPAGPQSQSVSGVQWIDRSSVNFNFSPPPLAKRILACIYSTRGARRETDSLARSCRDASVPSKKIPG